MSEATELARGQINGHDHLVIQLIKPADMPAIVRIAWPAQATVASPSQFPDTAAAMVARLFAEAATTLAAVKARRKL